MKRATRVGVALLVMLLPGSLWAQGLTIDHKAVGCIVAEKYPKMNACFSPASQVARARVYFRAEEGPPNWYYVEMKSDAACHAGVLPKPRKELIGKKIQYYVNAFDQKFVENRTVDNEALVVKSESDCQKDTPAAPVAAGGPGAVFPAVPAGFAAGGIGTATVLAAVGGAAVVGGGVALATRSSNSPSPTQTAGSPPTTAPAVLPTTTTTTTLPATPFNASFHVRMGGVEQASPINLPFFNFFQAQQVEFDMCQSTGPGKLAYNVDVNLHVETNFPFPVPPPPGFPTTLGGKCDIPVTFTPVTGISTQSAPAKEGQFFLPTIVFVYDVRMRVETVNAPGNAPNAHEDFQIRLPFSFCGVPLAGNGVSKDSPCLTSVSPTAQPTTALARRIGWASQLDIEGASGQVMLNGATAVFAGPGGSTALAAGRRGENRVEAQLVQGAGRPGTWRFELGATANLVPGSLRVLAGSVAEISGEAVVFRLGGRAGERVVFTFRTEE
jgi:hypothetical protein